MGVLWVEVVLLVGVAWWGPEGWAPKGGAPKGGAPKGGNRERWGPEGWGPEGWVCVCVWVCVGVCVGVLVSVWFGMKVVLDESGFGMKVVWDEKFWMKSAKFIPIWMKLYLTLSTPGLRHFRHGIPAIPATLLSNTLRHGGQRHPMDGHISINARREREWEAKTAKEEHTKQGGINPCQEIGG